MHMNYSFACPVPCNRKIEVVACDYRDAVDKIIAAGAMRCRNSDNQCRCEQAHFALSPMPSEQLRHTVSLCMREECDTA
jgi:hypothetical protein